MYLAFSLLVLSAFFLSLILTLLVRRVSRSAGFLDSAEGDDEHEQAVPLGGGIAIFATIMLTLLFGYAAARYMIASPPSWVESSLLPYLHGALSQSRPMAIIMAGGLIIFCTGIIDDRYKLRPLIKLSVQIIVATSLYYFLKDKELKVTLFTEHEWLWAVLTITWIVGITNAFNLLDNVDGQAAGVGVIVSAVFMIVAFDTNQILIAALLAIMIGSIAGFLIFNFPPASIFMGDAGSLTIGYFLAVLSVLFTFYQKSFSEFTILVPLIVFAIPLYDTVSVVAIRIMKGKAIFQGDRNHFSHRLMAMGMTPREAVFTIYLVTFCTGITSILLYHLTPLQARLILAQVVVILCVISVIVRAAKRK